MMDYDVVKAFYPAAFYNYHIFLIRLQFKAGIYPTSSLLYDEAY